MIVKNASIVPGTGIAPFTGDLAFGSSRVVKPDAKGVLQAFQTLRVDDLGDMRVFTALETIDATGQFAVMNRGWKEGDTVQVSDWKAWKSEKPLAVGSQHRRRAAEPGRSRNLHRRAHHPHGTAARDSGQLTAGS